MRKNVRQVLCLLLIASLIVSMSVAGLAAEAQPLLSLKAEGNTVHGDALAVTVDTAVSGVVADGKLKFTFDPEKLTFLDAEAGSAWSAEADLSLQANASQAGVVIIAFAGAVAADTGTIVKLNFAVVEAGQSTVAIVPEESYISDAGDYTLEAETVVEGTCPAAGFTDVDLAQYYHDGIDFVVSRGYMIGISDTKFAPNAVTDRAMVVTVLYRMAGEPEVSGTMPFADVKEGEYYYNAVLWASQAGIAKGITSSIFAPKANVTREQMVTFLARYAESLGLSLETAGGLEKFVDGDKVSSYAAGYMAWAVSTGIINGMPGDKLAPKENSTRGQLATVVERFATAALYN